MRRILILLSIYLISFNLNLNADSNISIELGKNYLTAVLNNSYDDIPQYINIKSFTKTPELTLWEILENIKKNKSRSPEEIAEIENTLAEQEFTEKELKETTIGEFVTFFLLEVYKIQELGLGHTTNLNIVHVSTVNESKSIQHHIFNVSQTIIPEKESQKSIYLHESKLVTVKNMVIVIPAKIKYLTKLFAGEIVNTSSSGGINAT